jgi:RNA polymerase sigma-70 factor (ECF subfamily)
MRSNLVSLPDLKPPPTEDDEQLARKAGRSPQVFAELYQRYLTPVYRYHLARTGQEDVAQDLTSQTFLAACEAIGSYRGQGSFKSWLFGIASHKRADYYRRAQPVISLEEAEEMTQLEPSPEDTVDSHLQMERVSKALQGLPAEQSEALVLRIFTELSAAEIGRMMGKSEAAVKMLVHRGLLKLKQQLVLMEVIA